MDVGNHRVVRCGLVNGEGEVRVFSVRYRIISKAESAKRANLWRHRPAHLGHVISHSDNSLDILIRRDKLIGKIINVLC